MSDTVRIVEMSARDGLQNEKTPVSVADRIDFIKALVGAGLNTVEVGAFVSPKAIPQMVGSDEVLRGVSRLPGEFHVLVPNEKGYQAARAAGAKVVSVFAAASEGFSRANINCSIAESIERFKPVVARARADGVRIRGYISTVLSPASTSFLTKAMRAAGLMGVFSFCRPSRGPISMIRTASVMTLLQPVRPRRVRPPPARYRRPCT